MNLPFFPRVLLTDVNKLNQAMSLVHFVLNFNNKLISACQNIHLLYGSGWKNLYLATEGEHHGCKINSKLLITLVQVLVMLTQSLFQGRNVA